MRHEEVLDWIDSADAYALRRPPAALQDTLDRDRETKRYYELSVMLAGPKREVDLLKRFEHAAAAEKGVNRETKQASRLLFAAGAAAFAALAVLLVTLLPDSRKSGSIDTATYRASSLELTYDIANDFGISDAEPADGKTMGDTIFLATDALDYCYAVSLF
ncbi:MAG: hypothetical protein JXQ30_09870 [Spirochaetes bacterium]|nr:hypothetical protein [Spirochaetota bacterium]